MLNSMASDESAIIFDAVISSGALKEGDAGAIPRDFTFGLAGSGVSQSDCLPIYLLYLTDR